jgi:hypothetical protein
MLSTCDLDASLGGIDTMSAPADNIIASFNNCSAKPSLIQPTAHFLVAVVKSKPAQVFVVEVRRQARVVVAARAVLEELPAEATIPQDCCEQYCIGIYLKP